jgi:Uma2 family endonuclease
MNLLPTKKPIEYPDTDGNPMAENTLQFEWIVTLKGNLDALFATNPDVFVAGDLLWYPVEGHPEIRQAPDALVAFGRPKGHRGSYMQWREDGVAPQVVFEVLSPGNRPSEMTRKFEFYERHGVEEYYLYDPDCNDLAGWLRADGQLREIVPMKGWTSPRLGIRFDCEESLTIRCPDGKPFMTFAEIIEARDRSDRQREQAERERQLSDWEKDKAIAERERERSEKESALAERKRERADKEKAIAEREQALAEVAQLRARLQAFENP